MPATFGAVSASPSTNTPNRVVKTKLSRKIVEMPVRYRERVYGETQIRRWRHGLMLLRMSIVAMRKLRFV